jgi:tetratricopeptide (TPR) repeat protein
MPAHTLIRVGRYEDAALQNARALGVEARYRKALNAPGPLGGALYYTHNLTFGVAGAMMAGDGPLAVKFAEHAQRAYPQSLTPEQRDTAIGRSYMALGRFAPEQAMAIPEPGKERLILRLMRHYARGEAAAARGDAAAVRLEATAVDGLDMPAGPQGNLKKVAVLVLKGRAAMLSGNPQGAVAAYGEATDLQQTLYRNLMDPPPWWYPARRSLAAALLASGQYADAAAESRRSLEEWPADGLALRVLADAEAKLGRADAATRLRAQAKAAYVGDVAAVPAALV